jgi:hypothetical protein
MNVMPAGVIHLDGKIKLSSIATIVENKTDVATKQDVNDDSSSDEGGQSIFGSNDEEESLSDEDISGTNMTDNSREEEDQLEAATLEETADACW